jgi:hypothetical protein
MQINNLSFRFRAVFYEWLIYAATRLSAEALSSSKIWRLSQNKRRTGVTLFCTLMKTTVGFSFSKLKFQVSYEGQFSSVMLTGQLHVRRTWGQSQEASAWNATYLATRVNGHVRLRKEIRV